MESNEADSVSPGKEELKQIFAEFLAEVSKFEELVSLGGRFLVGFQQQLELLRRAPITKTSELVQSIIKTAGETKRVKSYMEAGWTVPADNVKHMNDMNMCFAGLEDHLRKAKEIMSELEVLMDKAVSSLSSELESLSFDHADEIPGEDGSDEMMKGNTMECASFMAVIYGMVKQDYMMQEKIITSLSLKTSSEELDSYCLMWSLRPYVDDNIINQALSSCVPWVLIS